MILSLLQLCAIPSHHLDKTAPCPQLSVEANLYCACHNKTWHYAVAHYAEAFSEHDLDPLAEVTRDVAELVLLLGCVNSSAAVQVTHRYLQMGCCDTLAVPQMGLCSLL